MEIAVSQRARQHRAFSVLAARYCKNLPCRVASRLRRKIDFAARSLFTSFIVPREVSPRTMTFSLIIRGSSANEVNG